MSMYCDASPSFYTESFPVARKEHTCCECRAPILIGEKHLYAKAIQDGEWWKERQHLLCRDLCMAIYAAGGECVSFGMVKEMPGEICELERGDGDPKCRSLYARVLNRERISRHKPAPIPGGEV